MHNLLTDRLPEEISVGGRSYPVYTDFRRWILVTELLAEESADVMTKADCAAKLILRSGNPLDGAGNGTPEAMEVYREFLGAVMAFLTGGTELGCGTVGGTKTAGGAEAVFDFTCDAERICAAFRQAYGIDLCDPSAALHFRVFMALLRNLPRDTEFMQVVALRMTDTADIADEELRRRVRRAKANVRIRKDRTV